MTTSTVTIGSDTFDIIGSSAGFATYANGSLAFGDTHTNASTTNRSRALVQATRLFDRQRWQGTATGSLSWPREGVTDEDGEEVSSASVPARIVDGVYELALAGLADGSVFAGASAGSSLSSFSASGVSMSWFAARPGHRFPSTVMELIGWALEGAGGSSTDLAGSIGPGAYASGTDGESQFDNDAENDDDDTYSRTGP
jgi:hypothetical protein